MIGKDSPILQRENADMQGLENERMDRALGQSECCIALRVVKLWPLAA